MPGFGPACFYNSQTGGRPAALCAALPSGFLLGSHLVHFQRQEKFLTVITQKGLVCASGWTIKALVKFSHCLQFNEEQSGLALSVAEAIR